MTFRILTGIDSFSLAFADAWRLSVLGLATGGLVFFLIGLVAGRYFWRRFLIAAADLDIENQKWFDRIEKRKMASDSTAHPKAPVARRRSPKKARKQKPQTQTPRKSARQGQSGRSRTLHKTKI